MNDPVDHDSPLPVFLVASRRIEAGRALWRLLDRGPDRHCHRRQVAGSDAISTFTGGSINLLGCLGSGITDLTSAVTLTITH